MRTRHLFIRQQTSIINSIRAHLIEQFLMLCRNPATRAPLHAQVRG
jgi:hypothetical protein